MVRGRALVPQRAAGQPRVAVVGHLLVPGPPATEVVLQGVGCRRGELRLGRRGPLVVLDDAVLPGYCPLLGRVGLGLGLGLGLSLGLGLGLGLGLSLGLGRGEHGGVVELGGLVLQLGREQVELVRLEVACGGRLGGRGARGVLASPVGRRALRGEEAVEAQAGLGGGLDVEQGIVGGQETVGGGAEGGRVLEGEGGGYRGEGATGEGGRVLIGREGGGGREGARARESTGDKELGRSGTVHRCLPGRRAELGEEGGGRRGRLGSAGLQSRNQVHDGGVRTRGAGVVQARVEEPGET